MTTITVYYSLSPGETSHALRLRAASDYTGDSPDRFTEDTGIHGKPYFLSHPHVKFSVSHSGGIWICAFADSEIGCDVQEYRPSDDPDRLARIAKRWFSEDECRYFDDCGHDPAAFYRIWSRKEAYVKFTGCGIGEGFRKFSVTQEIAGCTVRDLVLPCQKKHAAAVACAYDFSTVFRSL